MATARILLILMCLSSVANGIRVYNGTTSKNLGARERTRRLIPYMTFYLAQPIDQSLTTSQSNPPTGYSSQILEQPTEKDRGWPYPPAQPPPQEHPQYLVPSHQYQQPYETRYVQQPSPLTKMITQNYLALAKQQGKLQTRLNTYSLQRPHHQHQQQGYLTLGPYGQTGEHLQNDANRYDVHSPASVQYQFRPLDHTQYRSQETQYSPQEPQYKPLEPQYKPHEAQYRPEVVLQYQTPAPVKPHFQYKSQPVYKKPVPVKQHLTEITRPIQRLNLYLENEEPRGFSLSNKPSYSDTTEPTVSIMQSQELEVPKDSSSLETPIATIAPKYRPTVTLEPAAKYHAVYVAKATTPAPAQALQGFREQYEYDDVDEQNVNDILEGGVSLSKTLPDRITPENLDSSIKTLSKLLKILQSANALPGSAKEIVKTFPKPIEPGYSPKHVQKIQPVRKPVDPDDEEGATPGQAGIDYPVYDEIPQTSFSCKTQRYKGFFGDPETRCQVWHYCDLNGGQASFLCPNGTIFSQVALTCDWWFNVKCASTAQLYVLNERLYKYILPQKPSFPEDYAGPVVDSYLTNKFKEIEQEARNKTSKEFKEPDPSINDDDHQYSLDDVESENRVRSISVTAVPGV